MIILIPAYKPDQPLVRFVRALREQDPDTEISSLTMVRQHLCANLYRTAYRRRDRAGPPGQQGRGAALRTGIAW